MQVPKFNAESCSLFCSLLLCRKLEYSLKSFLYCSSLEAFSLKLVHVLPGATFVQALVNFRQDCVYQAFRGPPAKTALKQFWDRLQSQEKPKEKSGAAVSSSSATTDADAGAAAVSSSSVPAGKDSNGTRQGTSASSSPPSGGQTSGSFASGGHSSSLRSNGALGGSAVNSNSSNGGGRAQQPEPQAAADTHQIRMSQ